MMEGSIRRDGNWNRPYLMESSIIETQIAVVMYLEEIIRIIEEDLENGLL